MRPYLGLLAILCLGYRCQLLVQGLLLDVQLFFFNLLMDPIGAQFRGLGFRAPKPNLGV